MIFKLYIWSLTIGGIPREGAYIHTFCNISYRGSHCKTEHECRLIHFILGQNYDKNDWMSTTGCFQVRSIKAAHQISAIQNCKMKVSRYGKDMVIRGYFWPYTCLLKYVHELLPFSSREGVVRKEERERERGGGQMLRSKETVCCRKAERNYSN